MQSFKDRQSCLNSHYIVSSAVGLRVLDLDQSESTSNRASRHTLFIESVAVSYLGIRRGDDIGGPIGSASNQYLVEFVAVFGTPFFY